MPERSPRGRSRELTEGADSRARGRGRGGGCGPGVRWRGGLGDKALGGRGDAWRETETNTSASGLAGRPARRFAGPAGRHGFRRRAIISLDAAARLLSGRGGKRTGPSRLVPASVRTPRTPVPWRRSTSSESDAAAQLRDLESGPRKGSFPFRAHRSLQITDIRARLANKQLIQVSINATEREQKG